MQRKASQPLQLAQLQRQQLDEIGAYLRQQRERQGQSLGDLAQRTLVRRSILADIEAGNLEALPEPVYVQGFIRRYAIALRLDGNQVAEAFPLESVARKSRSFWRQLPSTQLRPVHLYAAYVVVIASSVQGLSWLMNRSLLQSAELTRQEQAAQVERAVAQASANQLSQSGPVSQAFPVTGSATEGAGIAAKSSAGTPIGTPILDDAKKPTKPVQVSLTLTSQSWLRVMVDGKQAYEGVLSEGDQRSWEANEAVNVRAGNAGGVMVQVNNKPAVPMGNPGAVEEATYNSKQVAEAAKLDTSAAASALPVGMVVNRF
ncbi:MAG: helix-turn-helix domain-containing protein [Synechococcales cyanobacterium RU_4_20]|nr:helix-turn-helix domain-containing protein [Synechococcales cyanobacterium RU_4_20]